MYLPQIDRPGGRGRLGRPALWTRPFPLEGGLPAKVGEAIEQSSKKIDEPFLSTPGEGHNGVYTPPSSYPPLRWRYHHTYTTGCAYTPPGALTHHRVRLHTLPSGIPTLVKTHPRDMHLYLYRKVSGLQEVHHFYILYTICCFYLLQGRRYCNYFTMRGGSLKNMAKKMIPRVPTNKNV